MDVAPKIFSTQDAIFIVAGPRPKTNPSVDRFQYRTQGSDVHAG